MTGTLLAVAGGKGGCGKTTTALGLAVAGARRGLRTLAVDADRAMPDLHRMAGVGREPGLDDGPPGRVVRTVCSPDGDERRGDEPATDPEATAAAEPASRAAGIAGVVAAPTDGDVTTVSLSRCRRSADLTLVDCPAGVGRDVAVPLRAAAGAIVVTTPAPECLRDAARTAEMARSLGTPVAGVLVSRAGSAPAAVERLLDASVLATVPPVESRSRDPAVEADTGPRRPLRDGVLGSPEVRAAHGTALDALPASVTPAAAHEA